MTEIYLIRHGQTIANKIGLKQWTIDDERTYLTATGKQEAAVLAEKLNLGNNLTALYVSPLHRAQQTAQILNHQLNLPLIIDDRLREISYGDWDGQKNTDLKQKYPELFYPLAGVVRPEYVSIAHGESFQQVETRVRSFTKELTIKYPHGRIVVVTHGFTVRSFAAIVTGACGMDILEPDNCSVSKIVVEPAKMKMHLVYYNRVVNSHFWLVVLALRKK